MGQLEPRFLNGPPDVVPDAPRRTVVVGSTEDELIGTATATYRRDVGRPGACLYNGVAMGELVTVVNVDNGRSVECWTSPRVDEGAPWDELVLSQDGFVQIADPTDAPVHVEIRQ